MGSSPKPATEAESLLPVTKKPVQEDFSLSRAVAFGVFGITAFLGTNALWVELPLIFRVAPEGPRVAAYLILSLQCANIVPFLIVTCSSRERQQRSLVLVIYVLLLVGAAVACLMAVFHGVTTEVGGEPHSVALFVLAFCSACVSNTTNVTYFPFVARFPKAYTTALLTGEGLGGLLAGVAGIIQNPGGDEPRFSISAYFLFVAFVFLCGTAAFTAIVTSDGDGGAGGGTNGATAASAAADEATEQKQQTGSAAGGAVAASHGGSSWTAVWPLLLQQAAFASLAYGLIPSISPIMVLGYPNPAVALMWANILGMVADPLARALTGACQYYGFWFLTPLAMALAAVLVTCASMAPTPPLWDLPGGAALPVVCYTGFQFLTGFTLTMGFLAMRRAVGEADAEAAYRWGGFGIQAGAFTGTMIGFLLVIVFNIFYTGWG